VTGVPVARSLPESHAGARSAVRALTLRAGPRSFSSRAVQADNRRVRDVDLARHRVKAAKGRQSKPARFNANSIRSRPKPRPRSGGRPAGHSQDDAPILDALRRFHAQDTVSLAILAHKSDASAPPNALELLTSRRTGPIRQCSTASTTATSHGRCRPPLRNSRPGTTACERLCTRWARRGARRPQPDEVPTAEITRPDCGLSVVRLASNDPLPHFRRPLRHLVCVRAADWIPQKSVLPGAGRLPSGPPKSVLPNAV
jgi:hypothetical protein